MKDKGLELPDIILDAIGDGVVEDSELQDIFKNPDVEFIHKAHFNCSGPYGFYSIESLLPSDRCEFHKKFIEDYKSGKVLFEIAQDIWEAKEPEEIREKAERCKNKIKVFPGTDLFSMKLSEVSNYMDKRLKELEEMMKSL